MPTNFLSKDRILGDTTTIQLLFFLSVTLYPAYIRLGKWNLGVLRYSVPIKFPLPFPTFRRILKALWVKWQYSTPRFASQPGLGNKNIKYMKVPLVGIEPTITHLWLHDSPKIKSKFHI